MSEAYEFDPHLLLAASVIHKFFKEYGQLWADESISVEQIAGHLAREINVVRQGNLPARSLGGIMLINHQDHVEIGVQVTAWFPDSA